MMAVSTVTAPIMTSTTRATVKILAPIESRGPPWTTSLNLMVVVPCSKATLAGVGCPGRLLDERRARGSHGARSSGNSRAAGYPRSAIGFLLPRSCLDGSSGASDGMHPRHRTRPVLAITPVRRHPTLAGKGVSARHPPVDQHVVSFRE